MALWLLLPLMQLVFSQGAQVTLHNRVLLHGNLVTQNQSNSKEGHNSTKQDNFMAVNVYNAPLAYCSTSGYAMTGYTRDGRCADVGPEDQGAHHICIQMPKERNFCTVTGQSNWCADSMPCHDMYPNGGDCPIKNWCVCQWAFSRYIEMAGGCGSIDTLHCDATNMAALTAYQGSDVPQHQAALKCLKEKCKI